MPGRSRPRTSRRSAPRSARRVVDPRPDGRARASACSEFHRGPYETAVGDGRDAHRDPRPAARPTPGAPTRRSSGARATGRWPPRAPPCGSTGGAIDARRDRADRGRRASVTRARRRAGARRAGAVARSCSPGGRRSPPQDCTPDRRPARDGRVQAPPGRRADAARAAPRDRAGTARGGLMQVTMTRQRRGAQRATSSRALLLVHFLRDDARPDRHPLGLRHLQLRRLRRADGRRAGQVVHRARGDGRRPRDPHRRGLEQRRRARPGAAGLHRGARPAVRLLHAGHDADRPRAAGRAIPHPTERGDPRGDLRPDLPLHGLREHRPRGPVGGRAPGSRPPSEEADSMATTEAKPTDRLRPR